MNMLWSTIYLYGRDLFVTTMYTKFKKDENGNKKKPNTPPLSSKSFLTEIRATTSFDPPVHSRLTSPLRSIVAMSLEQHGLCFWAGNEWGLKRLLCLRHRLSLSLSVSLSLSWWFCSVFCCCCCFMGWGRAEGGGGGDCKSAAFCSVGDDVFAQLPMFVQVSRRHWHIYYIRRDFIFTFFFILFFLGGGGVALERNIESVAILWSKTSPIWTKIQ